MSELSPAMLRLNLESAKFSDSSARNVELMEQLIKAVLSGLGKG
jgi:hypothetical protein